MNKKNNPTITRITIEQLYGTTGCDSIAKGKG